MTTRQVLPAGTFTVPGKAVRLVLPGALTYVADSRIGGRRRKVWVRDSGGRLILTDPPAEAVCGARYDGILVDGEGVACQLAPHGDDDEHHFDGVRGGQHTVATWAETAPGVYRVSGFRSEPLP